MFISRTQPAEWYCLIFPRNRIGNAKTPYAVLVPFLHNHIEFLKGQRMKWRKKNLIDSPHHAYDIIVRITNSNECIKRAMLRKLNSRCSARFNIHDSPAIYQTGGVHMHAIRLTKISTAACC